MFLLRVQNRKMAPTKEHDRYLLICPPKTIEYSFEPRRLLRTELQFLGSLVTDRVL